LENFQGLDGEGHVYVYRLIWINQIGALEPNIVIRHGLDVAELTQMEGFATKRGAIMMDTKACLIQRRKF
jgi:hypothetical protein